MDSRRFVKDQVEEIRREVGGAIAINALSGGVDSSVVTVLAHRALGDRLKTLFVDNALMREGEPQRVVRAFARMGIPVKLVDARRQFLKALKGLTDPEDKRNAITRTFYKDVFGKAVRQTRATFLLHGTILTDIEETVAGIKRQHNILDAMTNREVQLVINTPIGRLSKVDDSYIRKTAIKCRIPYITTLTAALAAARGIAAQRQGKGGVRSLQNYHADIASEAPVS